MSIDDEVLKLKNCFYKANELFKNLNAELYPDSWEEINKAPAINRWFYPQVASLALTLYQLSNSSADKMIKGMKETFKECQKGGDLIEDQD